MASFFCYFASNPVKLRMQNVLIRAAQLSGFFMLAACSQPSDIEKEVSWVLSSGLCEPETVLAKPDSDDMFVSNICGFKKNGDGFVSLITKRGTVKELYWVKDLNAPAGMAIFETDLYVVDIDRVHVFDTYTREVERTFGPYANARAFNDIAISEDGRVFVSDSARHQVFELTDETETAFPSPGQRFQSANGMHIERGALYVGGEKLHRIDLESLSVEKVKLRGVKDIDGVEGDGDGGLTLSIVGGGVWHMSENGALEFWTAEGLSSTNHAYLPDLNLVVVPTGYDNTIVAFKR